MKAKAIFSLVSLLAFSLIASAETAADEKAIEAGKTHLVKLLNGDYEALARSYSDKITLMPGHEFLKDEYGIAGENGRNEAAVVDRANLLKAMEAADAGRNKRTPEELDAMMESLTFTVLETALGKFATDAADPVGTADGKLHFTIQAGDVLLKVAPPKGDFLLFHLREIKGAWKVVSEYLD